MLIVFKSSTSDLWLLSVIVAEYSIYFAGLTSVFLLFNISAVNYTNFGAIAGFIALVIFMSPIIRAYFTGQMLKNELAKAFQSTKSTSTDASKNIANEAFSFAKLFYGVPKVPFRTFTYVTYDDKTLTLDYYSSTMEGKRPCVIVIHGGAWARGDSKQVPELNSHLARAGYNCAAINYRLAPQWKCPAPIEDTMAALKYLCEHADELNIDKNKFVLLGRSAGGQIALLTAYTMKQPNIKGVVNFYGPADMIYGYMTPTNPLVINSTLALVKYVGGHYNDIPEKYKASSPIEFVDGTSVPTLTLQGLTDSLVFEEHGRRLSTRLNQHNVPNYLLEIPWGAHGFDYNINGPSGQLSTYAIEYFLCTVTGGH